MEVKVINTDFLIIGGGTAGCYAALKLAEQTNKKILLVDKANIHRSGCLAAGVNALNAYIAPGKTPMDYVNYAKKDANGIVRQDLLLSMANRLNAVTQALEKLGLVILKDEKGNYVTRGNRNIKINGENIKPILAKSVLNKKNITVLWPVNMVDYKVDNNKITGAVGFNIQEKILYDINAQAVLCATGGAAGLYKPNHAGFSRHKMWYSPFNTGAGYAMGIRAGCEMTTFEMRFIALRCKNTIAPTGTIAQGVGAAQINAKGKRYDDKYGITTYQRVYGTVQENLKGNGPCYLQTKGISKKEEELLEKAYLNMAPSQTLQWVASKQGPSTNNVEIQGTEPYIVGGHTASGYWVDTYRQTTLAGLFAAGDVAGGCPQKYVTGALVEGEIAAENMLLYAATQNTFSATQNSTKTLNSFTKKINLFLNNKPYLYSIENLEQAMQTIMDEYAGGISQNYAYNSQQLAIAHTKIEHLKTQCSFLVAQDMWDLLHIFELLDRLEVCSVLIAHLKARKETRWHSFAENKEYPIEKDEYYCFINSKKRQDTIHILKRPILENGDIYEHSN